MNERCAGISGTIAYKNCSQKESPALWRRPFRTLSRCLPVLFLALCVTACSQTPASLSRGALVAETAAVNGITPPGSASFLTSRPPASLASSPTQERTAASLSIVVAETKETRLSDDGTCTLVQGVWPCVYLETEGYDALRASLDEYNELLHEDAITEIDSYERFAVDCIGNGLRENISQFAYECTLEVARADDQYVSLLAYYYSNTGGVHPNYWYDGITFDSTSGEVLPLSSFCPDASRLADLLEAKLVETYDREWFLYDDLSAVILENYTENGHLTFTTAEDGLTFYFSPYDLSSYAAGAQVVTLTWAELN